ncbi:MAG TPA: GldG family protein, partial [Chthoniobacteraceae bacterium]|nr:GldG family protein [Chthoniobacteraceae bacterium]
MTSNLTPNPKTKVVTIKRFQIGLNVLIQLLVVAVIVVLVNYLSFRHFKRWDFSRDQKYALSSQTRNLLGSLQKPLRAVIFFSGASEIAPDVAALLREYEFASDKKFSTEIVDPFRNLTRAQELQAKYKFGANENIVILDYDGRNKFVNAADMAEYEQPDQMAMMMGQGQPRLKGFKGEQAITSALVELTEGKPNKIYFVSGHGEPELTGQDLTVFNESLKRQNIQAAPLNLLNVNSIPEDARALLICGPKYDLSELEIKLLSDHWEKNGRILVLLNPFVRTPRLAQWLSQNGVTPQDDRVIRVGKFLSMDSDGTPQVKSGVISQAAFVVANSGTNITKDLMGTSKQLLGVTQSLALDKTKEAPGKIRLIPLLESAEEFWGETDPVTTEDERPAFFDAKKDHMGPLTLAVAVERGGVADSRVKVDTSRLIVVGNADLLSNNGYRLSEGVSMDLTVNALNWLLDREQIIGIPPK